MEVFLSTERDVYSYIYDLLQNCSNSIVNALVLLNIAPSRRYYISIFAKMEYWHGFQLARRSSHHKPLSLVHTRRSRLMVVTGLNQPKFTDSGNWLLIPYLGQPLLFQRAT